MSKIKSSPKFKTEAEERAFWERHDSSDYVDWKAAKSVTMPNLKPSTKTISLRLPEVVIHPLIMLFKSSNFYAARSSFCMGVMPPMAMFGLSLL